VFKAFECVAQGVDDLGVVLFELIRWVNQHDGAARGGGQQANQPCEAVFLLGDGAFAQAQRAEVILQQTEIGGM